jgi:hypothetical protein
VVMLDHIRLISISYQFNIYAGIRIFEDISITNPKVRDIKVKHMICYCGFEVPTELRYLLNQ